ncbi:membrane protein insertion efficiency factor YidD [Candidatus Poribacteria bacterium]|nr:membrane protein insertion efficiency factor YidD [Candidatus Poribacteria bacterium]
MVEIPYLSYRLTQGFYIHIIIFFLLLTLYVPTYAGENEDLLYIQQTNPIVTAESDLVNRFNLRETSELKFAATGFIRLYQKFISSQDGPTCQFTPTCSRFGMACIQKYGMLRGILLAADRLIRCNGQQSHFYSIDLKMNKYTDPITDYGK